MYLLIWVAAAWLGAAALMTLAFVGAKRSQLLYSWLFGNKPSGEVHRLVIAPTAAERTTRLAA